MVQERAEKEVKGGIEQGQDSDTVVILDGLEMPAELYRQVVAEAGHDDVDEWIAEAVQLRFDAEETDVEATGFGEGEYGAGGYGTEEKIEES